MALGVGGYLNDEENKNKYVSMTRGSAWCLLCLCYDISYGVAQTHTVFLSHSFFLSAMFNEQANDLFDNNVDKDKHSNNLGD